MSTSRRVKKGPGRRPQSAKRARFMELRALGWGVRRAAREVGASPTAGHNWPRGHLVYRKGKVVGYVPPLDRLGVRNVSARFLSQDERIEIADLRQRGMTIRAIAQQLGRAPSTISRELRRNVTGGPRCAYVPFEAHRRAVSRRSRRNPRRIDTNKDLRGVVDDLLGKRWSLSITFEAPQVRGRKPDFDRGSARRAPDVGLRRTIHID